MRQLTSEEIKKLDPYQFMGELGKKVIHPGGSRSTEQIIDFADFAENQAVLDVGCGVGTSAIKIAGELGCNITAVDIDSQMLDKAFENVKNANLEKKIKIEQGDIQNLKYNDNS